MAKKSRRATSRHSQNFSHRRSSGIFVVANKIVKDELEAEDIVQEVFIRGSKHRQSMATMEKPALWLLKVATNLSITQLQNRQREHTQMTFLREALAQQAVQGMPGKDLSFKQLTEMIGAAVQQLPEQRKIIFQLSRKRG